MHKRTGPTVAVMLGGALAIAVLVLGSYAMAGGGKKSVKTDPLTGYQEATPAGVSSTATGSFEATIDDAAGTIDYTLS